MTSSGCFCFVCIYFLKVLVTIIGIPFVRKILKYFRKKRIKSQRLFLGRISGCLDMGCNFTYCTNIIGSYT